MARHRHFTRAAEELHLAQSALSHQIRRLEDELGTPLFERTSRRVKPTDAGVVIAIEIPSGAAVAGPFDIEQSELDGMISRVLASGSPRTVVH